MAAHWPDDLRGKVALTDFDREATLRSAGCTLSRFRWDQRTQDYLQRRLDDGKTRREADASSATSPARSSHCSAAPAGGPGT